MSPAQGSAHPPFEPALALAVDPQAAGVALLVAAAFAALALAARYQIRRRRARRRLLAQPRAEQPRASAAERAGPETSGALEQWLVSAGLESRSARAQFLLWNLAALLLAGLAALTFDASGWAERSTEWLREIPGGIGEILVPVMSAAAYLLALLIATTPLVWVRRRRRQRIEEVERDLPYVLGLLATLVESGLGFDAAAARVERALGEDRLLSIELARVRASAVAGVSRSVAFQRLADRLRVPSLSAFVAALVHAEAQGTSIAETLRSQANDLTAQRREAALRRAQTLPTRLAFPLVICFLPGVFVWTFGPAVSEFLRLAGSTFEQQ